MPEWGVALVALACLVGIVTTIVPILPGTLIVGAAILVWALVEGGIAAWSTAAVCLLILGAGAVIKYLIPGKKLAAAGVPTLTMIVGAIAGIVGFFVIPIVGVFVGFIAGVFVFELIRQRDVTLAWQATWTAMKASGLSMMIELAAALIATAAWATSVYAF
jgi:uncharacterized protein YqgC (DUF456 family)